MEYSKGRANMVIHASVAHHFGISGINLANPPV